MAPAPERFVTGSLPGASTQLPHVVPRGLLSCCVLFDGAAHSAGEMWSINVTAQ